MDAEPTETPETEDADQTEFISNPLKRAAMVFFSPRRVYESVLKHHTHLDWIIPVVALVVLSTFQVNTWNEYLRNDQFEAVSKKLDKITTLTEEQKAAQIEQARAGMEKMAGFTRIMTNVSIVIGPVIFFCVIALVLRALASFTLNGKLTFGEAFMIGALGSMISALGILFRIPLVISLESFAHAKLSVGFLFPEDFQESFLVKLVDFDLFTLWYLIVICIGLSVFTKTPLKKALVPMTVLWIVFRAATIGISGILGGIGA